MDEERDVEAALDMAIDRTRGAQRRVADEIREHDTPEPPSTELVVRRADDVRVLVDEERHHPANEREDAPRQ